MAAPSVTNTFTNGTTADATEVNTNFTDVINALTDGSSDLTFGALTAAGATALNGTVALGNATGDTVTFTGYVGSTIIPSTNATYDLGSSSLAWQALYIDNDVTDGGAIYFDAGSTEFLKASADGTDLAMGGFTGLDLAGAMIKEYGLYHEAKSADYTVTDTDGVSVILMTTSSTNRTVTLPTASANSGRVLTVKKVDGSTGICIVDGEGAETIDGVATKSMYEQWDYITVQCNGTAWFVTHNGIQDRFERKFLAADQTTNAAMGDIGFSNLIAGRNYSLSAHFYIDTDTTDDACFVTATNAGTILGYYSQEGSATSADDVNTCGSTLVFNAGGTTVTFTANGCSANAFIKGNNANFTSATLMELNNTAVTTKF